MLNFDYSELEGLIVQKYGTQSNFAKAAHISEKSLSDKLNNKLDKGLSQKDIKSWAKLLDISADSLPRIFFTEKVQPD